jgi:phosphate:Na+ symporter
MVGTIITWLGYPNPTEIVYNATIEANSNESTAALYGVSMLHTLFNTFNTAILISFTPLIVKIVTNIIKSKSDTNEDSFNLKFINAGPVGTAELAVSQARNEIIHFAENTRKGFSYVKRAIHATDEDEFEKYRKKLVEYEEMADQIQFEIATFLNALPQDSISEDTNSQLRGMYKIIGELESLGDSGEAISRIISRRNIHNKKFTDKQIEKIDTLYSVVDKAYSIMIENLANKTLTHAELRRAVDCEIEINDLRNNLREEEILKIEKNETDYQSSTYYIDLISELERMGDYIINVSEAL